MDAKFIGKCESLNELGQGIVYYDNKMFVVDNLLIGEEAEIIVSKKTRLYYLGRVHRLIKESPDRNKVYCPKNCGGCNLIHLNYEKQLEFKNNYIKNLFNEFTTSKIIKSPQNYNYRNKVIYAIDYLENDIIFGLYEENTHQIIKTKNCLVNHINSNIIINKIKEYLLTTNTKSIRYILLRFNSFNDVLVGLVTDEILINEDLIVNLLKENVTSIIVNFNDFKTNRILGDNNKIIYGNNIIQEKIENYKFNISLNSFFQINYHQMLNMYRLVKESNLINKDDILLDAYSGTSTIGIYLSDKVKKVISVEANESSYLNALENTKINNITNITCINKDCTAYINKTNDKFNIVIMDPPRGGCSKEFLLALINKKVEKLIYISCNPKTLKRDLDILKEHYDILNITPLDMFPNTLHIETVVSLRLKTCQR